MYCPTVREILETGGEDLFYGEKQITKPELIDLLIDIAKGDLAEGAELEDHPCMIASRIILEQV